MNEITANVNGRERMAWGFLLVSFAVFLALMITIPVSASAYLQNARRPLVATVQANQGTVNINDATGTRVAVVAGEPGRNVESGASVLTDAVATALIFISPPNSEQLLARLTVYSNTVMNLQQSIAPRFHASTLPHHLDLDVAGGRLRLTVPRLAGRPLAVTITTPQGMIAISEPGQYSIEVNNEETRLAVQEGRVAVTAAGASLELQAMQRAQIQLDMAPTGPLVLERNLIQNGDFSEGWDRWQQYVWRVESPDLPRGQIDVVPVAGSPTLYVARQGEGHADVQVRQWINQDVTDYQSLQLLLTFRIVAQSLGVCGVLGSECPLFIRIDYVDENGIKRTWQQGFYAMGEVADTTPGACVSCPFVQGSHEKVTLGQTYFYNVDLQAELAQQGSLPPRYIESIYLLTSGHSFEVEVVDVALIAEE